MTQRTKKYKRSKKDKLVGGVLGGFAEYIKVDPTLVRILWLIILGITGFIPALVVYLVAFVIVPEKGSKKPSILQRFAK